MNAFTGHGLTAFYVRVPERELGLALDILADVIWSPTLAEGDIESERDVILEEIRMREDAPDDLVHELFARALFPSHPLGREVTGTVATMSAMSRDSVAQYHADHYRPANMVVAVAGNIDHDVVAAHVADTTPTDRSAAVTRAPFTEPGAPVPVVVLERPLEQAHVVLGTRSLPRDDPDRYALAVVDQVLGGGMSSRLFQEVRERRGLAYSVFSYRSSFQETGAFSVYCATAPERVPEVLKVVGEELDRLVAQGAVTDRELASAKGYLTGSLALSLESSSSRMHRIGRGELTAGRVPSLDEVVAMVEAVTPDDVRRVIERVLGSGPRTLAVVGPVRADDLS
jgi:predicted Zn-dependent peptidase